MVTPFESYNYSGPTSALSVVLPQPPAIMVATSLLYHLHTLLLFTKSDVKYVIIPVVRNAYSPSCLPSWLTSLFSTARPFSPRLPLRRAVSLASPMRSYGYGFILCILRLRIRHSHILSQKMPSIIRTDLFRRVAFHCELHARYAG